MGKQRSQLKGKVDLEGFAGSNVIERTGGATRGYNLSPPDKSKKRTKDIELPSDELKIMNNVKPLKKKKRAVGLS